eukprot:7456713-Pyramimonas_sp.AAC.1
MYIFASSGRATKTSKTLQRSAKTGPTMRERTHVAPPTWATARSAQRDLGEPSFFTASHQNVTLTASTVRHGQQCTTPGAQVTPAPPGAPINQITSGAQVNPVTPVTPGAPITPATPGVGVTPVTPGAPVIH